MWFIIQILTEIDIDGPMLYKCFPFVCMYVCVSECVKAALCQDKNQLNQHKNHLNEQKTHRKLSISLHIWVFLAPHDIVNLYLLIYSHAHNNANSGFALTLSHCGQNQPNEKHTK